jgi:ADP-ribosylglycohydrolase
MERNWAYVDRHDVKSSGYAVHSFESFVWCLLQQPASYEAAVLEAINLGDDGHAIGSLVGGFAGLIHGADAIPAAWLAELARKDEVEALIARFVALLEKQS